MVLPLVTKGDNLQTNPQLRFGIQSHQSTWLHSNTSHQNHENYYIKRVKKICNTKNKICSHLFLVQGLLYTDTFYTPNLHEL